MYTRTLAIFVLAFAVANAQAAEDTLRRALEDEIARSMEQLQVEGLVKPHFIGYTVHDDHSATVNASRGGIENQLIRRDRTLQVEVRVGSSDLDNTNVVPRRIRNRSYSTALPLEDDYDMIRERAWLVTDSAYKLAVEMYAAKQAALQNTQQERVSDFSDENPHIFTHDKRSQKLDLGRIRDAARELSKIPQKFEFVHDQDLTVFANRHQDTYVNSDGSYFTRVDDSSYVRAIAWTQADDGHYLTEYVSTVGRAWNKLLDIPTIKKQLKAMYERLDDLQDAEALERYNGPLLIEEQAAAQLLALTLAPNVLNFKMPVFEENAMAASFTQRAALSTFKERIGARVVPRGWSVYDDPTLDSYNDVTLVGQYPVDSDGLPSKRVSLIERGVLKTLLSDRNPTEEILHSSGSNATGAGPSVSNLIIETTQGLSSEELRNELIALVQELGREYGIRVDRAPNPHIRASGIPSAYAGLRRGQALPITRAYKVFPDGREEQIRNAVISMDLLSELKNLIAYSESTYVHSDTYVFQSGDVSKIGPSYPVYVSIAAPDMLVEEATIVAPPGIVDSPPLVSHPLAK